MTNHETRARTRYLVFLLPFVLAFIVWLFYPPFVEFVLVQALKYPAASQSPPFIWTLLLVCLYTWYLFSAIGVGGTLVVAAWMWKQRPTPKITHAYPTVSFVVPVYNEEQKIVRCIDGLFKCAIKYPGPSEIIIVDDGSTDDTFDVAWTTIQSQKREFPNAPARVVRHMANLGEAEAMRTGVNRAMGEYVVIVDADTFCDHTELTELVDHMQITQATAFRSHISQQKGTDENKLFEILQPLEYSQDRGFLKRAETLGSAITALPSSIGLYRVEALRQLLNENKVPVQAPRQRNWSTFVQWSSYAPGFVGALPDLIALLSMPVFFWFAPDRLLFILILTMFLPLVLTVGIIQQTLALKFAYNQHAYERVLWYTRLYYITRLANNASRLKTLLDHSLQQRRETT